MKIRTLLLSITNVILLSGSLYATKTEYIAALVDENSTQSIVALRKASIKAYHEMDGKEKLQRPLPSVLRENEPLCIDVSETHFHQKLHATIDQRFDVKNHDDLKTLQSALSKVSFSVDMIDYSFGKYCALILDKNYTPDYDEAGTSMLTGEEEKMLAKYISEKDDIFHVSLFKYIAKKEISNLSKDNNGAYTFERSITQDEKQKYTCKQLHPSSWADIKSASIQEIAQIILIGNPSPKKLRKELCEHLNTFLSVALGPTKSFTVGDRDDENNLPLVIKEKNLPKQCGKIADRLLARHAQNLTATEITDLPNQDEQNTALKARLTNYMNGAYLFGPIQRKDRIPSVPVSTGTSLGAPALKIFVDGMRKHLDANPMTIRFNVVSGETY